MCSPTSTRLPQTPSRPELMALVTREKRRTGIGRPAHTHAHTAIHRLTRAIYPPNKGCFYRLFRAVTPVHSFSGSSQSSNAELLSQPLSRLDPRRGRQSNTSGTCLSVQSTCAPDRSPMPGLRRDGLSCSISTTRVVTPQSHFSARFPAPGVANGRVDGMDIG